MRGITVFRPPARATILSAAAFLFVLTGVSAAIRPALASGPESGATYVALGDSYSSGEGLGAFQSGTAVPMGPYKNTCHRSARSAYADLSPAVVLPTVKNRAFWACSGATVQDIENVPGKNRTPKQYGQPEQELTVGSTTQYITLTVGGDDLGFSDIGTACTTVELGSKVISLSKTSCSAQLKTSASRIPLLEAHLKELYQALLNRSAPGSELMVAGYPRILPASYANPGKLKGQPFCTFDHLKAIGTIGMYVTNAKAVASFEVNLNATIQAAVSFVAKEYPGRIKYSDIFPTSVPRNCKGTTPNATVAGFELSPRGNGTGPGGYVSTATFHPTKAGQEVYAKAVEATFKAFTAERNSIKFVDSPGTGSPPVTLGAYTMSPFATDPRSDGTAVTSISGPTGTLDLSASALVETVGVGWNTWSNGYTGSVYWFGSGNQGSSTSVTITLPPHTAAVYFYAEPDEYATYDLSASANNGTTSGDQTVYGNSGASYFGFYAVSGTTINTITVSCPDDFALGEFGIASA
jgi:hypothetical protein